jgi:hypothetical protein
MCLVNDNIWSIYSIGAVLWNIITNWKLISNNGNHLEINAENYLSSAPKQISFIIFYFILSIKP